MKKKKELSVQFFSLKQTNFNLAQTEDRAEAVRAVQAEEESLSGRWRYFRDKQAEDASGSVGDGALCASLLVLEIVHYYVLIQRGKILKEKGGKCFW